MTHVSVIIPAYNAAATLERTLFSVRAQSHEELEILVVDDGSTDETAEIASRHALEDTRVQVHTKDNGGVAKARNFGIERATSDWIAPLDADDIWHPDTIKAFLQAIEAASEPVVFAYTWSRRIDENDRLIADLGSPTYQGNVIGNLIASNFIRNASATMLSRSTTQSVGGYDASLQEAGAHGAEDIDLYLRLARTGPVAVAKGYHVGYRQMPGSMSQSADRMRRSIELALTKAEQVDDGRHQTLFELARTNYDLYAAGLSLSAGSFGGLAQYLGNALRQETIMGLVHLSVFGPYRLLGGLVASDKPKFSTLNPRVPATIRLPEIVMKAQDRLYAKALETAKAGSI